MLVAHKIRLAPNNVQARYFSRTAGTARFAYNWALVEWKRQYEESKVDPAVNRPNEMALRRKLNAIKRTHFPWMLEVTKNAPQMAIIQLGAAFKNFFAGRTRYPRFRKKGRDDRFTLSNDQFKVDASRIRIPRLGWVKMREALRFTGTVISASISRTADHWFASITVDTPDDLLLPPADNQGAVGVDLGVTSLATLSTGKRVPGPKAHKRLLGRLKRLSRSLSRKVKGSANRCKAKAKLARLHARIANIRQNCLHQLSNELTSRFCTVGIEDLNVKGMMKNRSLSRAISDMGFYEFRRQLEYKAMLRGGRVVVVDRWYPSSKTCSSCGHKLESLPLAERRWTCPLCTVTHDRDVNAAINLRNMAVSFTASACGEEGSGLARKRKVKPASEKQESNSKVTS